MNKRMTELGIGFLAIIFVLSTANPVPAQEGKEDGSVSITGPAGGRSGENPKPEAGGEKSQTSQNKEGFLKPQVRRIGGKVAAVDTSNKTLSIHQETVYHDRIMKMKVDEKVSGRLKDVKPGDLVNVWISGGRITELQKIS